MWGRGNAMMDETTKFIYKSIALGLDLDLDPV
jgi:hypothetical protein